MTRNHSALNLPRVGSDSNQAFTALQLNLSDAETEPMDTKELSTCSVLVGQCMSDPVSGLLIAQLSARFSKFHKDSSDCRGVPSTYVSWADYPPGYDNGAMYFPEFGIAIDLVPGTGINFYGLNVHAARPARPMPGTNPEHWAIRLGIVHYTHDIPATGKAVFHWFPARAHATPWPFTPELQTMGYVFPLTHSYRLTRHFCRNIPPRLTNTAASIIEDGLSIMEPISLFVFAVRGILLFMAWVLGRLPSSFQVEVDFPKIIEAITMAGPDGSRINSGAWQEVPTLRGKRTGHRGPDVDSGVPGDEGANSEAPGREEADFEAPGREEAMSEFLSKLDYLNGFVAGRGSGNTSSSSE